MSDSPCYNCGAVVSAKRATHTRDGRVACPSCTRELGIKVIPRIGFQEVMRMQDRKLIEADKAKFDKQIESGDLSSEDLGLYTVVSEALAWVLGEDAPQPSEKWLSERT